MRLNRFFLHLDSSKDVKEIYTKVYEWISATLYMNTHNYESLLHPGIHINSELYIYAYSVGTHFLLVMSVSGTH